MSIYIVDTNEGLTEQNLKLVCTIFGRGDLEDIADQLSAATLSVLCDESYPSSSKRLSDMFRLSLLHVVEIDYLFGFTLLNLNKNISKNQVKRWRRELDSVLLKDVDSHKKAAVAAMIFIRNKSQL